jgi:sulfur carrier protein ThiS
MKVSVKRFGTLRPNRTNEQNAIVEVDLPDQSTVGNLLAKLGIEEKDGVMVTVNSRLAKAGVNLTEKDLVKIFDLICGG